jgi:hypothetical protein
MDESKGVDGALACRDVQKINCQTFRRSLIVAEKESAHGF